MSSVLSDDLTQVAIAIAKRLPPPYRWQDVARPEQLPPEGDWSTWVYQAGRGAGKTRSGAEWVCDQVDAGAMRIGLIAPTAADNRDVQVEGESGILAVANRRGIRIQYEPSKRRLTWPSGAIATTYSAEEPERLRGPQHDAIWADEVGAWKYPGTWDMALFGLRLGTDPRAMVTTTPRPTKLMRDILGNPSTVITRGSTYDNRANLAPSFFDAIITRYEGTRLGRQELMGELIDDVPGALWTLGQLDDLRTTEPPTFTRIVIAVDPATTSGEESDETGIVVCGMGEDGHGYVIADRSTRSSPQGWASIVRDAYYEYGADRVIAERNQGGDMVTFTLRTVDRNLPVKTVHAAKGKRTRAEPVASLYEQGRVHHVGTFPALEDQMCAFLPDGKEHDDRVDALVYALTELMLGRGEGLMFGWA